MIDVTYKTCKEDGCEKYPLYNKESEKIAIYCNKHKKNDMININ